MLILIVFALLQEEMRNNITTCQDKINSKRTKRRWHCHAPCALNSTDCVTGPFIKGVYMGSTGGIATVKMGWKLADGKPAVAYTSESNVVPLSKFDPGTPVGLINSITKRESGDHASVCTHAIT